MTEEYDLSGLEDPNPLAETKEIEADPLLATKLVYVDNLKKEIQELQKQMASLQYQLDIRVTALTMYQRALSNSHNEVVEEESKENGKDAEVKYTEKDLGEGLKKGIKVDESNS